MVSISLMGTKIGMTQIFNNQGSAIPVTVLQLGPCFITQNQKPLKSDGYKCNTNWLFRKYQTKKLKVKPS